MTRSPEHFCQAVACFTLSRHRRFVSSSADPECFRAAQEAMVRQLAKAALDTMRDVELSAEGPKAFVKLPNLLLKVAAADQLRSSPDSLLLYHCMNRDRLSFLDSLWQEVRAGDSHRKLPVHFQSEPSKSRMRGVNFDLLCKDNACAEYVSIAPLDIKRSSAGSRSFTASTTEKGRTTACYYGTLVYHDLSFR